MENPEKPASPQKNIRNFSIIAHIDHGKSTLADRLLEVTGAVSPEKMTAQILDSMDLERERGITIKAHAVRLKYRAKDGEDYILNLIDTPGHVDFSYEVSRSLASCEGALLLVDAVEGLQAQSFANAHLAVECNLKVIPVINKIDLPAADPERVREQIEKTLPLNENPLLASAKEGTGVKEVLEAIIEKVPPPSGSDGNRLKALIFDSWFDNYRGVIVLVRVFEGVISPGMKIRLMGTAGEFEVNGVGVFIPKMTASDRLGAGEVGYVIAGIKRISDTKIGDTITSVAEPASEPCPGYKEVKPLVFCGLYPTETSQFEGLKSALEKLKLNDSSFNFEPETSTALGFGFRCGFLGLLHMDIIKERLEREFNISLICTTPNVTYRVTDDKDRVSFVYTPHRLPDRFKSIEEPFARVVIFVPQEFVGSILELCRQKRGVQMEFTFIGTDRVMLIYELPMGEILWDFYDKLKSLSKGYATMDYEFTGFKEGDITRLDILLNGKPVDALSLIVHRDKAYYKGKQTVEKLGETIPRQLYEVVVQAAVAGKIIARQTIKPLRKDVTAKCYGGDITRKRKLLERQKEGKKRMKQVGKIEIPEEAFLAALKAEA